MNTMNAAIELDEEMISVSPICKLTPVNDNNNKRNLQPGIEGAESPPSVFGHSPPAVVRRPVLQHQHSYAGHEEEMDEETRTVGSVPRAPSGRAFLSTRHLSIEDYSNSNESTTTPRNDSLDEWANHHQQQQQLFGSPATPDEEPANEEEERQESPASEEEEEEQREETAEERARREEEESIALAQMLMAEEAVASHRMSADFLRMNSAQFSAEDFAALQDALREEEDAVEYEAAELEGDDVEEDLSYDALLRLGETIGDVKTDRWSRIAQKEIAKLETFRYDPSIHARTEDGDAKMEDIDDSELKCLVCQYTYEKDDELRRLPCGHCFHKDCIDQWLQTKDCCAYCRQCILPDKGGEKNEAQN